MSFNLLTNYSAQLIQQGGAKAVQAPGAGANFLLLFTVALVALLVRAWLVYMTYNAVAPVLISNSGSDVTNFRPLTFMESVLLAILTQNLFN